MHEGVTMGSALGRFRKIHVRIWDDPDFRASGDDCRLLCFQLLTSHYSTPFGLFVAGAAALAEEVGWEQKRWAKAFKEAEKWGFCKKDPDQRVVWVCKVFEYEAESGNPKNLNVVIGWSRVFAEVPDCDLKAEALRAFTAVMKQFKEQFLNSFLNSFLNGFRNGYRNSLVNQYQEQYQYQYQYQELRADSNESASPKKSKSGREKDPPGVYRTRKGFILKGRSLELFEEFWKTFDLMQGKADAADAFLDIVKARKAHKGRDFDENTWKRLLEATKLEAARRPKLIQDGNVPKMAQGWLNSRRFEDEFYDQLATKQTDTHKQQSRNEHARRENERWGEIRAKARLCRFREPEPDEPLTKYEHETEQAWNAHKTGVPLGSLIQPLIEREEHDAPGTGAS